MGNYVAADTTNYRGWRILRSQPHPEASGGLGQDRPEGPPPPPGSIDTPIGTVVLPTADPNDPGWFDLTDHLRLLNERIQELEDLIRTDPDAAAAAAMDVLNARKSYEQAADKYIFVYRLVFGEVPSGLTGLGIAPAVAAIIVAALLVVGSWIVAAWQFVMRAQSNAQQQKATGKAEGLQTAVQRLQQAEAEARSRGDQALADQYHQRWMELAAAVGAAPPSEEADFGKWFQKNWGWVAVGTAAVLTLPQLVKKF